MKMAAAAAAALAFAAPTLAREVAGVDFPETIDVGGQELKLAGKHVHIARTLEAVLARTTGKPLPINVDGAIAAVLCDLGFPPELGNAFFIIARVPGLVAHVHEEKTRMKPMRKIHPEDFEYDGPADREA